MVSRSGRGGSLVCGGSGCSGCETHTFQEHAVQTGVPCLYETANGGLFPSVPWASV